jgi:hypothetical protein
MWAAGSRGVDGAVVRRSSKSARRPSITLLPRWCEPEAVGWAGSFGRLYFLRQRQWGPPQERHSCTAHMSVHSAAYSAAHSAQCCAECSQCPQTRESRIPQPQPPLRCRPGNKAHVVCGPTRRVSTAILKYVEIHVERAERAQRPLSSHLHFRCYATDERVWAVVDYPQFLYLFLPSQSCSSLSRRSLAATM